MMFSGNKNYSFFAVALVVIFLIAIIIPSAPVEAAKGLLAVAAGAIAVSCVKRAAEFIINKGYNKANNKQVAHGGKKRDITT